MAAWLQRHISGGASRVEAARLRVLQRLDFGVVLAGRLGESLANDLPVLAQHAADARIGGGVEHASRSERKRLLHGGVVGIGKHLAGDSCPLGVWCACRCQGGADSMQAQGCLLVLVLDRHKAHAGPRYRLADCRRVRRVILAAFAGHSVRRHQSRRHQLDRVSVLAKQPRPVMRARTSFHADQARRQLRNQWHQLIA